MVAKISSGSSIYGVLSYNQEKVDKDQAHVLHTNRIIEPINGDYNMNYYLRSFEPYLLANQRTEKPVLHISINPDPKDNLTDEQLSQIAQTYMDKMGYGDQPFIVFKHEDIERKHIHIVSLRIDETGKKIDHNFERKKSMDICRNLEKQYGLVPADKKQQPEGLLLKPVAYQEGDLKHQVANIVRSVAKDYSFLGLKEYSVLLSQYNVGMEEVKHEVKGIIYNGIIYSVLDEQGNKISTPFKSSLFGKAVGYNTLTEKAEKSKEDFKNKNFKNKFAAIINDAIRDCRSKEEFKHNLQKHNAGVLFRKNDEGRIYGVTFFFHNEQFALNGSRIGKEFSANTFNSLFNSKETVNDKQGFTPAVENFTHEKDKSSSGSGLFDFLTPDPSGAGNAEAEAFARSFKRKRRRKRKH